MVYGHFLGAKYIIFWEFSCLIHYNLRVHAIKKINYKVHPVTGHESPQEYYIYSCTLSLTSALDGVVGRRHGPAALPPGNRPDNHC